MSRRRILPAVVRFIALVGFAGAALVSAEAPVNIHQERTRVDDQYVEGLKKLTENGKPTVEQMRELEAWNGEFAAKLEEKRTNAVEELKQQSQPRDSIISDVGKKPGDPDFRHVKGDRDIQVEDHHAYAVEARKKGFTVTAGPGYYKIEELDVVVWPHEDKPFGLNERADRLHDREVARDKTVINQIKKSMNALEIDPRVLKTDADREKWIQEIAKAGEKAGSVSDVKIADDVLTELASGKRPDKRLWEPGATDLEKMEAMQKLQADVEERLKRSYQKSRAEGEKAFRDLETEIAEARRNGDTAKADELGNKLHEAREIDAQTEAVLSRKNPKKMFELTRGVTIDEVHDFETGEVYYMDKKTGVKITVDEVTEASNQAVQRARETMGRATKPADPGKAKILDTLLGKSGGEKCGTVVDIVLNGYDAYQNYRKEADEAAREGRSVSYAKIGLETVENVLGFTQGWEAGEKLDKATGDDLVAYIREQQKAMRDSGIDPQTLSSRLTIAARSIFHGTVTGGYEGIKGLPLLGNAITGTEQIGNFTYSVFDSLRTVNDAVQTRTENAEIQQKTQDRAVSTIKTDGEALLRKYQELVVKLGPVDHLGGFVKGLIGEIPSPIALKNRINDERAAYERLFGEARLRMNLPDEPGKAQAAGPVFPGDRRPLQQRLADEKAGLATIDETLREKIEMCRSPNPPPREVIQGLITSRMKRRLANSKQELDEIARLLSGSGEDDPARADLAQRRATIEALQGLANAVLSNAQPFTDAARTAQLQVTEYNTSRTALLNGIRYFSNTASEEDRRTVIAPLQEKVEAARIDQATYDDLAGLSRTLREIASKLEGINMGPLPELPAASTKTGSPTGQGATPDLAAELQQTRKALEQAKAHLQELLALLEKQESKPEVLIQPPKPSNETKKSKKKGGIDIFSPNVAGPDHSR